METGTQDHYRVLQVDPSAEVDVIQAAYRVLARRYHPDLAGDDTVMKRINAAWEVLGDKDRRAGYDRARSGGGTFAQAPIVTSEPTARAASPDHAGPPQGRPFGTVLTYGRYEGWSLGQVALVDPEFLEWMRSVPGGRYLRPEIDAILKEVRGPLAGAGRFGSGGVNTAQRMREAGVLIG
ncbi:MAG TPA: J domain-containing protein [Patescibacteria group bacterium]|nr:J domain-containing protein [Patescibacteria group bacterium]